MLQASGVVFVLVVVIKTLAKLTTVWLALRNCPPEHRAAVLRR